ncbi:MAG: prolyl oligopeptidase family serine peptidase, partial [Rhodospirillaceae bacterium]|nr:prolyl oligopeptidase family serine peptidase [Rhodospirillaceae bacterium]
DIFGPRRDRATTQPIHFADGKNAPPMLLISGETDRTVRPRNSKRLATRLRETGGRADIRLYDDTGHVGLVAALAKPLRGLAPTLDDTDQFLRKHRSAKACSESRQ